MNTEKQLRNQRNAKRKTLKKKTFKYKESHNLIENEIARLYEGQMFDNWIHLFDTMDIYYPEEQRGNSRTMIQENIQRYLEIEKQPNSHSLIITKIYDTPVEKEDNRKWGNHRIPEDTKLQRTQNETLYKKIANNEIYNILSKLELPTEFKNWSDMFDKLGIYLPTNGPDRLVVINHLLCYVEVEEKDDSYKKKITSIHNPHLNFLNINQIAQDRKRRKKND